MKTKDFALHVTKDVSEEGTFEGYGSVFGVRDSYNEVVEPGAFVESLVRHKREGSKPLMLWQHNPDEPVGVWDDLAEDNKGLWGKGRLLKGVRRADEALIMMKAGAIQGLSIGYREIDTRPAENGGARKLLKLDLMEVSLVSFPANRRARIDAVKAASEDMLKAIDWLGKAIILHEGHMDGSIPTTDASQRKMMTQMRNAYDLLSDAAPSGGMSGMRMDEFARRLRDGDPMSIKEFEDILRDAGVPKAMATQIASVGYAKAIRSESEGSKEDAIRQLRAAAAAFSTR